MVFFFACTLSLPSFSLTHPYSHAANFDSYKKLVTSPGFYGAGKQRHRGEANNNNTSVPGVNQEAAASEKRDEYR